MNKKIKVMNIVKTQPKSEFYQSFSQQEIENIINGLLEHKEIPFKYFYKGQMTAAWDDLVKQKHLAITSTLKSDIAFLENNFNFIEQKKSEFERLNIIDLGPGNSYPVKNFINKIDSLGWLNRYIAIDISEDMLNLSQTNIKSWFPKVEFRGYVLDIEEQNFEKIALDNRINSKGWRIINILLYLGGTIGNHKDRVKVLNNFQKSLGDDDILILSCSLKLPDSIPSFNYQGHISEKACNYFMDLLNIIPNDCEICSGFNPNTETFFTNIIFHKDYLIEFDIQGKIQEIFLGKGEEISIYRYFNYSLGSNLEVDNFLQEANKAKLQVKVCNIDTLNLRALVICQRKNL